jgi:hypothetical protein
MTAVNQMLKTNQDKIAVRKSIDLLLHLLQDFIPRCAMGDAERRLYEAFETQGIELTSKAMRQEYEAWKSTQLDVLIPIPIGTPK